MIIKGSKTWHCINQGINHILWLSGVLTVLGISAEFIKYLQSFFFNLLGKLNLNKIFYSLQSLIKQWHLYSFWFCGSIKLSFNLYFPFQFQFFYITLHLFYKKFKLKGKIQIEREFYSARFHHNRKVTFWDNVFIKEFCTDSFGCCCCWWWIAAFSGDFM